MKPKHYISGGYDVDQNGKAWWEHRVCDGSTHQVLFRHHREDAVIEFRKKLLQQEQSCA